MNTRFIGVKELRQNMAKISAQARKKHERIVVLRKNRPIFELVPLADDAALAASFARDVAKAREDVRKGRAYDQEEIERMFGL